MMNMKKLLALLLAIVMIVGMFPMNVFAENEEPAHLDSCTEDCTGCECTCHQVNPASDDPAEPESPADNCPNCDNADCIGCDGEAKLQNDGGEAKDEVCETCQKDPCECKDEVCETCQKDPCECKSEVCETCQKDPCECKSEVCETCQKDPCECKSEVCETCQKDPCECKNTEETKCGICGGEHADKDCTYCLSCKTDRSNCVICEECETHAGDHRIDCSKAKKPDMATPPQNSKLFNDLMALETVEELEQMMLEYQFEHKSELEALTAEQINALFERLDALDPTGSKTETETVVDILITLPNFMSGAEEDGEEGVVLANNVHNVTLNKWYGTLSAATEAARNDDVIEVHNSFTESTTVKIQKQRLTIRAAEGKNPTISWNNVEAVPITGATDYSCIVIYTDVTTYTYFGKSGTTGTLTFDASGVSNDNFKGKRARVMMHCGKNRLYIHDGIVITGGNTGGGNYNSEKDPNTSFPTGSGEVLGMEGAGSGIFMYSGELVMMGGRVHHNYSLYGHSSDHNYVGGGGGIYLNNNTSMIFSGGTIDFNAAASGGGGGILVGYDAKLNMSGGKIDSNVTRFSSGGGIGVRTGAEVKITGGTISKNFATNHGGGLFARGDSIPLEITGGIFTENVAGSNGGAVLFWTVGDDVTKNTVKVGGYVKFIKNEAENGAGISVGREVLDGKPIGRKAKLIIEGNPTISENIATKNGGGIHMQSDEFSAAVNTVEISGGTFSKNEAKDGAGIYVPGGTVTMTGGTFSGNKASDRGAGIFTGGGTMTIGEDATFESNVATDNGGGAFVQGGIVTMNSGSFTKNKASNGGAMYVNQGNVTMMGGKVSENTAVTSGGAVYVTGGNFDMISGTLEGNESTEYGGGAYVDGGNITIGVENCGGTGENHTVTYTGYKHPEVCANNSAFGGGLAVDGGTVNIYCGTIINNDANNDGTGKNIFMYDSNPDDSKSGVVNHVGGTVGEDTNHGVVAIGGQLNVPMEVGKTEITIRYRTNVPSFNKIWTGKAPEGYYLNLPYCPDEWEAKQNVDGLTFVGWTYDKNATAATDVQDTVDLDFIRSKDGYRALGDPTEIKKVAWKVENGNYYIDFYAVWAPIENQIQYKYSLDGENIVNGGMDLVLTAQHPNKYQFDLTDYTLAIPDANISGYTFQGWKMYAENETISNWDADATSYEPTKIDQLTEDVTSPLSIEQNFGDIVMVAIFEPAFTSLKINKTVEGGIEPGQTFVFHVVGDATRSGEDVDTYVTIGENGGTIILNWLPVGEYTVTEVTDWSWRYSIEGASEKGITLNNPKVPGEVSFTNQFSNNKWLSCETIVDNQFGPYGGN